MNVLFLSPDFVLPAERGLRVRALSQLRVLASIGQVEHITLLSLADSVVSGETLRALERKLPKVAAVQPVTVPPSIRKNPKTLPRIAFLRLFRGKPYLIAKCDSSQMRALVRETLKNRRFDVVYLGYFSMLAYLPDVRELAPRARVVLEEHNVEWRIFDRLAASLRPPMNAAVKWEARAMRTFEKRSLREVDAVIAISDADAKSLRELAGVEAIVVPPCIEPGPPRKDSSQTSNFGYIGHLSWQPNAYGLDWFCTKVWPFARRNIPGVTLTIAGPGLRASPGGALDVPRRWAQPGIKTVGFVQDLEDIYRGSAGMVAPVIGGSGVRMKLLETMSAGMPTVTTGDGAAGLGVEHGREVLIADDPEDFARCMAQIASDGALRERLRHAGYAFLAARHSEPFARVRLERALGIAEESYRAQAALPA